MQRMIGYAGVLDVLGFSSQVRSPNGLDALDRYLTCIEDTMRGHPGVHYVVFSDSVVLTTERDELASFLKLVSACSQLMSKLFAIDVPVRGAVAHGFMVARPSDDGTGTFVAGTPIIEAYEYERAQDWVGIIVAPSVRRQRPDLEASLDTPRRHPFLEEDYNIVRAGFPLMSLVDRAEVPLHGADNGVYSCIAVVPSASYDAQPSLQQIARFVDGLESALTHLRRMHSFAPNPQAQRKFKTTIDWLDRRRAYWVSVRSSYQAYETDHPPPRT